VTSELELLDQLRDTALTAEQEQLVDALEVALGQDLLWPLPVREAAEAAFGGLIHNPNGRTHKALDRHIRHALRVWRRRYDGMNAEQYEYAGDVLAAVIRSASTRAPKDDRHRYVYAALQRVVNEPRLDEGMKRRAARAIDLSEELAGVGA